MTSRRTALSAVVFLVAFIAGVFLDNDPDTDASAATFTRYYASHDHRVQMILSAALLSLAALAWVVTVGGLRDRVGDGTAARIATSGAAVTAALIGVAATLLSAIPAAMTFGGAPEPSADLARFLPQAGYMALTFMAMPAAALTVAAICVAALRANALPRWLAYAGFAAAVLLLASFVFFPMAALVVWVVATAVVLARRPLRIPLPATASAR